MEGEQFLAINPDTLNDKEYFSYRDLQKLCVKLELGGNGKREELEERLRAWHRGRSRRAEALVPTAHDEENIPMNVIGNNFSLMKIEVKCKPKVGAPKRASLLTKDSTNGIVSPTLLRPLRAEPGTPGKGILKQAQPATPGANQNDGNAPIRRLDKITFSPFNGVKVIPNRMNTRDEWLSDGEYYDDGENDENVEEDDYYDNYGQYSNDNNSDEEY